MRVNAEGTHLMLQHCRSAETALVQVSWRDGVRRLVKSRGSQARPHRAHADRFMASFDDATS